MRDVELVDEFSLHIADGESVAEAWRYAADLVAQDDVWAAIDRVAKALAAGALGGTEIARFCE